MPIPMTVRLILAAVCLLWPCWPLYAWPDKYDPLIYRETRRYMPEVDWRLFKAQLIQESSLNPDATSPVGAAGLAQIMPATWTELQRQLVAHGRPALSPYDPRSGIAGGAMYMGQLRRAWSWHRPELDKHNLALASYNGGLGNLLKAQKRCSMAVLYDDIVQCLPAVTGKHAEETMQYVPRIRRLYRELKQ